MLLGCYRKGEAEDVDVYVTSVASILCAYPEAVVMVVTDPVRGIPGRIKWLPAVAEVRDACEAEMAPVYAETARRRRFEESKRSLSQTEEVAPERRSMAADHWERNIRPQMGGAPDGEPKETPQEALDRLSKELWSAPVVVGHELAQKLKAMKEGR